MCGITGILDCSQSRSEGELPRVIARMTEMLVHRGPDDVGIWTDAAAGIALGHRRLSILDLSASGHQPMFSADQRYALVYNGEIYNHAALRHELQSRGHRFGGHSDTEVFLAAVLEWGIAEAVGRFNGMFAFALWDRSERRLTLGRDRLGEKPLYYGWQGSTFLFGSELKALRTHPAFRAEIDRGAIALFLKHGYIPAPFSIYTGISKLPPGCLLAVSQSDRSADPKAFWSLPQIVARGLATPFGGSDAEAIAELDRRLRAAVRLRMEADVPLGAFLSGGIDSSTIVALMQAQSAQPVQTFSIGFAEAAYNEAEYGKAVAQHLGTQHTNWYVTPEAAREVIPDLPTLYDEPFADSSQIPTFLVSQLARKQVTVCLSGDGGDELFGGYGRYFTTGELWRKLSRIPRPLRGLAARVLQSGFCEWTPARIRRKLMGLGELLAPPSARGLYQRHHTHWKHPASLIVGSSEPETIFDTQEKWGLGRESAFEELMYLDTATYLPDDILVKVDRASMAVGLEARVPLLDHELVEFAWQLPLGLKVRDGRGKWILRQLLQQYVPRELVERPKMGFGVPIDSWLRGPLRDWAESLLDESRLRAEGYLHPESIRRKWAEHLSGRVSWHYHLWDVLMFQAWLAAQGAPLAPSNSGKGLMRSARSEPSLGMDRSE